MISRVLVCAVMVLFFGTVAAAQQKDFASMISPLQFPGEWEVAKFKPEMLKTKQLIGTEQCGEYFRIGPSLDRKGEQEIWAAFRGLHEGKMQDFLVGVPVPQIFTYVDPRVEVVSIRAPPILGLRRYEIWVTPAEHKQAYLCLQHTKDMVRRR